MAFPGASEVELVVALQEGAAGNADFTAFLARLAAITGARFAAMVSRVPGSITPVAIVNAMPSGAALAIDNPAVAFALSHRLRPERIYTTAELADLVDIGGGLSMNAALASLGAVSANAIAVAVPGTVSIALGIFGTRGFDAADGMVLRRLFPYLQAAARTASRLWHERLRAAVTADLARRGSLGWFLLDRAGVVLEAWRAGRDQLPGLRILPGPHGDRLAFADRAAEQGLAAILEQLTIRPKLPGRALWISHDPPVHLQIAPVPCEWAFDPRQPAALTTLYGQARPGRHGADRLVDLFGLLPSEARLAMALAGGDRLSQAAHRLGLTVATARNYSKKIFAKTNTHGQADLVRLIWASGCAEPD